MKKLVINGLTLSTQSSLTGVQRVCREIILRLDELLEHEPDLQIEYAYMSGAENALIRLEELKRITPVAIKSKNLRLAKLFTLPKYIKKQKALGVCIGTEMLMSKNHVSCIHDIRPAIYKHYDSTAFRWHYRVILWIEKHFARKYVTVSDYQKDAIIKQFRLKSANSIETIYNGWEHLNDVTPDESVLGKNEILKKGEFFYALGSLAPHKNFEWIIEVAKRNPDKIFAIAGGKNLKNWGDNIETDALSNLIFLGYVSDAENKALMQACRAFLHPSKYEGFGIPPLEALACGAPIIISNATCLPEVYEDCAHYFDPDDYEVDLDKLLSEPVGDPTKILQKCSWERAAAQWMDLLKCEASK